MPSLALGVTFALAADLLLLAVFAYLWRAGRGEHLRFWVVAWLAGVVRYGVMLLGALFGPSRLLDVLLLSGVLIQAVFLLRGAFAFVNRPIPRLLDIGFLALGVGTVGLLASGVPRAWGLMPLFAALGAVTLAAGGAIFADHQSPRFGRWLTSGAFLVWGLHRFNYPFLIEVAWFAPWGLFIASALELSVAVGMLVLYFERARVELERSEARYRSIVEGSVDGIYASSPEGRFLQANSALVQMLGYGSSDELCAIELPADLYVDVRDRARLIKGGGDDLKQQEVSWKRKDGSAIQVELRGRALRDADGKVTRYEGLVRDVTRERVLAQQLDQARRLEALGRVAGGVAHDFNNLLTVILGSVDLLVREVPQAAGEYLESIREASARGAALTGQLLAIGRKQPQRRQTLELGELLDEVAPLIRRLIGEHVELLVEHGSDKHWITVDREHLVQVLLNLAANARDAMPDGGPLKLHVETGDQVPSAFEPAISDPTALVKLEVADQGSGMSPETLAHIFEPFFTTKDIGQGTGLGLASVYGVMAQSGGHVEVDSELGEGTRFVLWFPRAESIAAVSEPALSGPRARAPGRSALVVEDELLVRTVVAAAMRDAGFEVEAFARGGDLLAALDATPAMLEQAEILISDVLMPGLTGPSLVKTLRERRADLPVLYISGYPDARRGGAALDAPQLPKPFTPAVLVAKVLEIIGTPEPVFEQREGRGRARSGG